LSKRKTQPQPRPARNGKPAPPTAPVSDRPLPMLLQRAAMMGGGGGFLSTAIMLPGGLIADNNYKQLLMVALLLITLRLGVPLKAQRRARVGYACAFLTGYMAGSLAVMILGRVNAPVLWSLQSVILLACVWGVRKSLRG